MFNWLKKILGSDIPATSVIATTEEKPISINEVRTPRQPSKKTTAKKDSVDLEAMSKKDLLTLAKEKGIKANSSLKKAELVERLK